MSAFLYGVLFQATRVHYGGDPGRAQPGLNLKEFHLVITSHRSVIVVCYPSKVWLHAVVFSEQFDVKFCSLYSPSRIFSQLGSQKSGIGTIRREADHNCFFLVQRGFFFRRKSAPNELIGRWELVGGKLFGDNVL